jgi:polar amino acid transport system substrate-binding protein
MGDGSVGIASDLAPTGALRAAINLGNPVLAQGTAAAPTGVTVDLAREIGARLGLPVEFACFDAARDSFAAVTTGRTDICFLAIEPARAAEVAFTAPYVLIEGVYAVSAQSPLVAVADVDRPGEAAAGIREPMTVSFLHGLVEELKADGFVADALRRSGQTAPVAPPG